MFSKSEAKEHCNTITDMVHEAVALAIDDTMSMDRPRARYGLDGTVTVTLTISPKSESGVPASFARQARKWGFDPDIYGKRFNFDGDVYEICGFAERARKKPVLAKRLDREGAVYKWGAERVRHLLNSPDRGFLPSLPQG